MRRVRRVRRRESDVEGVGADIASSSGSAKQTSSHTPGTSSPKEPGKKNHELGRLELKSSSYQPWIQWDVALGIRKKPRL